MNGFRHTKRSVLRLVFGAFFGLIIALGCWLLVFAISTVSDAPHWKGTLLATAVLLPIWCVPFGVIVFSATDSGSNYLVANLTVTLLASFLTTITMMAVFEWPLWIGSLAFVPIFFMWAWIEERYFSATINSWVERLSAQSPKIGS